MKLISLHKINYKRIGLHLLYWLTFILYFTYTNIEAPISFWVNAKFFIYQLPFDLIVIYTTLYYLIPKFFESEKYILFIVTFLLLCFTMLTLQRVYFYELIIPDVVEENNYYYWSFKEIFYVFKDNLFIYMLPIFYKITNNWYKKKLNISESEKNLLETELKLNKAELKLLKSQIHPHFLFNTLNNLYGLTIAKSDNAPDMVIKISELLDYMLYDCNSNSAKLVNELKYLKNYIELEKIRYRNKITVDYTDSGINEKQQIAPLLLLPFLENSFKHGVNKQLSDSWIKVSINVIDSRLEFNISNSKINIGNSGIGKTKGIGIENVRKRLDLLYKDNYNLEIQDLEDQFRVKLELNLINLEDKKYVVIP